MRSTILLSLRLLLGAVFVYAAYTKLRQPWLLFALSIDSYGMLPEWAVLALARTLPWAEAGLGLLLMSGLWLRQISVVATALLALFLTVIVVSYVRGNTIDCGCFGAGEAFSWTAIARDSTLLLMGVALSWLSRRPAQTAG